MYSPQLLQRFFDPKWAGEVARPTVVAVEGNPACGDVVQLSLVIEDGLIMEAKFKTLGCAIAIATSDAICELLCGKTLSSAAVVTVEDLTGTLGLIPESRESCVAAPLAALRSALAQLRTSTA